MVMTTTPTKKKYSLFAKIESYADALKVIKDSASAFIWVGALEAIVGLFLLPELLFDAFLYFFLGLVLIYVRSRIAAVLLLLLSGAAVVVTFLNQLGIMDEGGTNIFLALIVFWAAIRAVEATFKLHGRLAHRRSGFSPDEYVIPEELKRPRPPGFSLDELMQSDKPQPRFSTLEWGLIGLAGVLVLALLVVVFVVF